MAKLTGNLEIDNEEGVVRVSINPQIYSMGVIYSVAHSFTDKSYVMIDGDREIEIVVEIKPFDKKEKLEELGRKFNNRLLSYVTYEQKRIENSAVRQLLLYRALMTNSPEENIPPKSDIKEVKTEAKENKIQKQKKEKKSDAEDIAFPWEKEDSKDKQND